MVPISMPCGPGGFSDLTMKHKIEPQPWRPTARGLCFLMPGKTGHVASDGASDRGPEELRSAPPSPHSSF